ncbi:hypothetical protein [Mesobacillus maritimus]|nr:hypothetical protein [Mesobacillus maritimus]
MEKGTVEDPACPNRVEQVKKGTKEDPACPNQGGTAENVNLDA